MGLTGFNRQRKRALSEALDIDERLADKLLAYGYSNREAVKSAKAEDLHFLSEEELKAVKGKKAAQKAEKEKASKKPEEPVSEEKEDGSDISDEISYADGIDPDKAKEAFAEISATDAEYPHHWYSGHYFLSNGSVVKGKKVALEAQDELK